MAIDFPNSPATNDIYTVDGRTWKYDGQKWNIVSTISVSLHDLTNVNAPSPVVDDILKYDGAEWVNSSSISLDDATAGSVTVGVISSNTISTNFGDLTISPSSSITTIGGYLYTDNLTVFTDTDLQGNVVVGGTLRVEAIREKTVDGTISSDVLTCSHLNAGVFYVTSPGANFTVNVTNLPTDNGFTATVSIFVQQGATGRIPNALQIAGVGQTIKWSGGSAPTPTSSSGKIDVFTFTLIRRSSTWTVLGSANLNY